MTRRFVCLDHLLKPQVPQTDRREVPGPEKTLRIQTEDSFMSLMDDYEWVSLIFVGSSSGSLVFSPL